MPEHVALERMNQKGRMSQPSSEGLQAEKEFESSRIGTWFS